MYKPLSYPIISLDLSLWVVLDYLYAFPIPLNTVAWGAAEIKIINLDCRNA